MPASLTVQVRLGFSMGWRIWTPNEVRFYAKTLAHSYFILVILKSKFLKEMIWIVNYNLFMGTKKYHVFIEFLQFGMKSKDERCIWKKIVYISLVARHKKMTKAYFNFRDERFKLTMFRAKMSQIWPHVEDQRGVWKLYESKIFKDSRLGLKMAHAKRFPNYGLVKHRNVGKGINSLKRPLIFLRKKYKYSRLFYNKYLKHRYKSKTRLLKRIGTLFVRKSIFDKKKKDRLPQKVRSLFTRKFFKKIPFFREEELNRLHGSSADTLVGVSGAKGMLATTTENLLMESFRFDPIYESNRYSVLGGPKKRLSRNLRRAFKGKHVKIATDLVWFWEKVAKMLTYFVRKHVFLKKRII